jgi:transcriptional regulator with XRE-family HTH domain
VEVHEKIRKLRELRGFKQEAMANALGISVKAYSKIESGQTALTSPRLHQIATVLGIEPGEILNFREENIYRSCQQCVYQQLSCLADTAWLTERLCLQQQVKELQERLAVYHQQQDAGSR